MQLIAAGGGGGVFLEDRPPPPGVSGLPDFGGTASKHCGINTPKRRGVLHALEKKATLFDTNCVYLCHCKSPHRRFGLTNSSNPNAIFKLPWLQFFSFFLLPFGPSVGFTLIYKYVYFCRIQFLFIINTKIITNHSSLIHSALSVNMPNK